MSDIRLIDANALKEVAKTKFGNDITSITVLKLFEELIDNAPTVEDRYGEGYAQGYIDGSTGADMRCAELHLDNTPTVAINKDFYKTDKSNPINRSDLFQ